MNKNRLEAFSDGVIAVIITIMVLEMKAPHAFNFSALMESWPVFLSYVLSFVFIGIYWNNHHHLLQAGKQVNGTILWANLHLLFWLSLIPFTTAWMGESHFQSTPVALYGVILLLSGVAYFILTHALIAHHGRESTLAKAIGNDFKGKASILIYAMAVPAALFQPLLACTLYISVAVMWLIPDRRIEKALS